MSDIAIETALASWVESLTGGVSSSNVFVAFSGGLDSTALLHGLAGLLPGRVQALHVNHGLQASADQWSEHCREQCDRLAIPFKQLMVTPDLQAGLGLEAAARLARYAALERCVPSGDVLVTGHHRNDQAETVLLALMRASGPAGLAAMPSSKPFGSAQLHRPFLKVSRLELESYGHKHGLRWIEDPSNQDQQLRRNFLRHKVIPTVQELWPDAERSLAKVADLQSETLGLLKELAVQDLADVGSQARHCLGATSSTDKNVWLSVSLLRPLSEARKKNVIRYWLEQQGLAVPQSQNWSEMKDLFIERPDANPVWHFSQSQVRRYGRWLLAFSALPSVPLSTFAVQPEVDKPYSLPMGFGEYLIQCRSKAESRLFQQLSDVIELRFRQGGERFRPRPGASRVTLKNALNGLRIPPWQRDRTPLLFINNELVAFGEHWLIKSMGSDGSRDNLELGSGSKTLSALPEIRWVPEQPNGWVTACPIEE